jgi:hypothetical protein
LESSVPCVRVGCIFKSIAKCSAIIA